MPVTFDRCDFGRCRMNTPVPYHDGDMADLVFEAKKNAIDATAAFFFDQPRPECIRLHLVREEVLSVP
jgi:hypothetical protein